jgi:hypothetical protein
VPIGGSGAVPPMKVTNRCMRSSVSRPSNARHHPPRTQPRERQALRMRAPLFAVGCMLLLDRAIAFNAQALLYLLGSHLQLFLSWIGAPPF